MRTDALAVNMKHQTAFTLIELLVAIGVFAVMGALAYAGLNTVLATQAHTRQEAERLQTLQLSFRYLQRDIEQIVNRPVRDQYGDASSSVLVARQPGLTITHAGWRNPAGQTRSQLQRVAYDIDEDTLVRIVWPMLDGAENDSLLVTPLLAQTEELEVRALDGDNKWHKEWPPLDADKENTPLPVALEITLTVDPWGQIRRYIALR